VAGALREVIVADAGSADATAEVADIAGCRIMISKDPIGARLKAAAAAARAPWLLFLRPGTVLDGTWVDDATGFIAADERRRSGDPRIAVFHPLAGAAGQRPAFLEALALLVSACGRPRPQQGLLIAKRLYERLGGHAAHDDAEADLLRRLGRRRIVVLRSGAAHAE